MKIMSLNNIPILLLSSVPNRIRIIMLFSLILVTILVGMMIAGPKQIDAEQTRLLNPLLGQGSKDNSNTTIKFLKELLGQAYSFLGKKPTSVIEKTQLPASGDKHDFLSLAPYCWPDSSKPGGLPYICRDGMVNPQVDKIPDGRNLGDMITRVNTLCLAYYFTGNVLFASKAAELIRVWFLNNDTRMNPNLQFAEMVPGLNNGTAHGIIAGKNLPDIIDSIRLIQNSSAWTNQDQEALKLWFSEYLDWLLNSSAGKKERQSVNNHGTWYDVQTSSIALFLNKTDIARAALKNELQLMKIKIKPDGSQPYELVRRTSLGYSILNLLGFFKLANIGQNIGFDLWNYQTPEGAGLQKALEYLFPFTVNNQTWPYDQIRPLSGEDKRNLAELLYQAVIHYPKNENYQGCKSIELLTYSSA